MLFTFQVLKKTFFFVKYVTMKPSMSIVHNQALLTSSLQWHFYMLNFYKILVSYPNVLVHFISKVGVTLQI
jgi:hypothetical protein